jgi:organic radical activating enzyme
MTQKKYFCYEIFKNIAVWSLNSKIGYNPCSFYRGYFAQSDHIDLDAAWRSPERKKIIDLVNQDLPVPGCESCYEQEQKGLESRRIASFDIYENWHNDTQIDLSGPQGIDYSVGNLCNLKCVICGPNNSTQWIPDYQKLHPVTNIEQFKYKKNQQIEIESDSSLSNVLTIHFHGGGEPLMSAAHVNLLKRIKKVKGLSDVRIFYNTNGTVRVDDDVLALWSECKLVELYFSLDDIGSRFEYQRTGASFQSVYENLQWFYENMPHNHLFKINCVWGYLNLFYLDQLVDWHKNNFSTTRFGDPIPLLFQQAIGITNVKHVSYQLKNTLLNKFSQYPALYSLIKPLAVSDKSHNSFLDWIQKLDQIRNQDFKEIAPEWAKLLHEHTL